MKLYQYLNFDEKGGQYFRLNTVQKNKLWLSNPKTFNDPQELKYVLDTDYRFNSSDPEKLCEFIVNSIQDRNLLDQNLPILDIETTKEILMLYGGKIENDSYLNVILDCALTTHRCAIACFSESSSNTLMWAHYGKGHTGFCVTYEVTAYPQGQTTSFFGRRSNNIYLRSVDYTVKPKLINYWDIFLGSAFEKILCTKSIEWSYEKEIRLIAPHSFESATHSKVSGVEVELPDGFKITEITAGCMTEACHLEHLKHAVISLRELTQNEIKFTKAVINKSDFNIEIHDVE